MTEQAAYCYSMVIVPLYDTLGANACAFIVNQSTYMQIHFIFILSFFLQIVGVHTSVSNADFIYNARGIYLSVGSTLRFCLG